MSSREGPAELERRRTARLLLLSPRASDLSDLVALHADPRVMATLGGLRDAAATEAQLRDFDAHWERRGFGPWVLRDPDTSRFLGRGGLRRVKVEGREEVEVLYALVADAWGRGYATELARESIRVAFGKLHLSALVCFTLPSNARSRAVMRRVGFEYQRDFLHAGRPHVLYRLLAPSGEREVAPPSRLRV